MYLTYILKCVKISSQICGRSLVVELQLPKLTVRVRFPSPAPKQKSPIRGFLFWSNEAFPIGNMKGAARMKSPAANEVLLRNDKERFAS